MALQPASVVGSRSVSYAAASRRHVGTAIAHGYRQRAPLPRRPGLKTDELERDGVPHTVNRPGPRQGIPSTVVSEREGTAIQLNSQNLDEELLLELAASTQKLP